MRMGKRIRVLVVDDSMVFREVLSKGIVSDPLIDVVAVANDPYEARDKIIAYQPDVMTCDIEMPKMNGIDFIKRLLPQYSLPVIVVSTVSHAVFDAMNAGAVDFVTKPDVRSVHGISTFLAELIHKIKIAANSKVAVQPRTMEGNMNPLPTGNTAMNKDIIAIGASTGGTEAICCILKSLSPTMPGIVIVQHIPPVFSRMFAERLNNLTALRVKEAQTGDRVERGSVLIAPGDRHMRIKKQGDTYRVECFEGDRISGHCPSVDVLFESVAKEAGAKALGILLTGMGYDGAKGLLSIKRKGGSTIGQDEATSVVYGMPKVAHELGALDKRAALKDIPQLMYRML